MNLRPTLRRLKFYIERNIRFLYKDQDQKKKIRKNLRDYVRELTTPRHPMAHYDARYASKQWCQKFAKNEIFHEAHAVYR